MLLSDRVSRGKRVQEIQRDCGFDENNIGFARLLNESAERLGLEPAWHPTRLSKVRNGTQDLSVEDATVIAYVDPQQRGWTWISFGVAAGDGENPYDVLVRNAKKRPKGRMA